MAASPPYRPPADEATAEPRRLGLAGRVLRKSAKPFYPLYYRLLYGRSFPGAAALKRLVRRFEEVSGRGDVPLDREEWEEQYRRGDWSFLADRDELRRYRLLARLVREQVEPGGRVLDVGSGEGLLYEHLEDAGFHYTGLDLSETAVQQARERWPADGSSPRFVAADAETFQARGGEAGRWDAVVLNECLYYFSRPIRQAERYLSMLAPGGAMVISMFRSPRTDALARVLARRLPKTAGHTIESAKGQWDVGVYQPGD